MSTSFGKEVGLIHEIIVQGKRYGADETFWLALFNDKPFLVHSIDYASFHHGTSVQISDRSQLKKVVFACFAQSGGIGHSEVTSRVEQFGRFATDQELKMVCGKVQQLWDEADCPPLQYPIVGVSPEDVAQHHSYFFAITYGADGGRPVLSTLDTDKQKRPDGTFYWAPGTTFAVVCEKRRLTMNFDRNHAMMVMMG